jgi:hypothetical protein
MDIFVVLIILTGAVFFVLSSDKEAALRGVKENLKFLFLFLFIRIIKPTTDDLRRLSRVILIFAFVVAVYGIYQYFFDYYSLINRFGGIGGESESYFGLTELSGHLGAKRAYSFFLSNFTLAYFLMTALIISFSEWITNKFKKDWKFFLLLIPLSVCFALTLARSAWGGFVFGIFVLLFLAGKTRKINARNSFWYLIIGLLLYLIGLLLPQDIKFVLYQRGMSIFSTDLQETAHHYYFLIKDLELVKNNPFGMGLGSASAYVGQVWNESSFFKIATEMGLAIAAMYSVIILSIVYYAHRIISRTNDKKAVSFALAGAGLASAYFISGLVFPIWITWYPTMLMWVFGASIINWAEITVKK